VTFKTKSKNKIFELMSDYSEDDIEGFGGQFEDGFGTNLEFDLGGNMNLDDPNTFGMQNYGFEENEFVSDQEDNLDDTLDFTELTETKSTNSTKININFDELEDGEDYKNSNISEDEENDYKDQADGVSAEESHQLSSPFANGLVALRIEVVENDGGIKVEELKKSRGYQDKEGWFKKVVMKENSEGNEEEVVCNICLDGE
jgi:hypothetical protein